MTEDSQAKIKRLEKELSELKNIIHSIPVNIFWKDINGIRTGCNDRTLKCFNLPRSEYVGKTDVELHGKEIGEKTKQIDKSVMEANAPKTLEEYGRTTEGKSATYITHKIPLHDETGKVTGILGVSIDITKQKEAEERAKKAEIREKVSQEKIRASEAMAGMIAHELRTPLACINMSAGFLGDFLPALIEAHKLATKKKLPVQEIPRRIFEALGDRIQAIEEETHRSNFIINSTLKNIKGAEEHPEDLDIYSITDCVNSVLDRYPFNPAEEKDKVHFKTGNDFTFNGSKMLMSHVLFNLLKNALYYLKDSGKEDAEIFIWLENNELHFKDTGSGIDKKDIKKLFERFFSKRLNGTGLGLAFCKDTMQKMGGDITCQSEKGQYTEFVLTFPK